MAIIGAGLFGAASASPAGRNSASTPRRYGCPSTSPRPGFRRTRKNASTRLLGSSSAMRPGWIGELRHRTATHRRRHGNDRGRGLHAARAGESMVIARNNVGPDYFRLLRIPQLAGEEFSERDDQRGRHVVIVIGAFAQRFYGSLDPEGTGSGSPRTSPGAPSSEWWRTPNRAIRCNRRAPPTTHRSSRCSPPGTKTDFVAPGGPRKHSTLSRQRSRSAPPAGGLYLARPLNTYVHGSMFALLVSGQPDGHVGSHVPDTGPASDSRASRLTPSANVLGRLLCGWRLGKAGQVLRLVLRDCIAMIAWGWILGAIATLAAARAIAGMLPGVGPGDPMAFGAAALFLGL